MLNSTTKKRNDPKLPLHAHYGPPTPWSIFTENEPKRPNRARFRPASAQGHISVQKSIPRAILSNAQIHHGKNYPKRPIRAHFGIASAQRHISVKKSFPGAILSSAQIHNRKQAQTANPCPVLTSGRPVAYFN